MRLLGFGRHQMRQPVFPIITPKKTSTLLATLCRKSTGKPPQRDTTSYLPTLLKLIIILSRLPTPRHPRPTPPRNYTNHFPRRQHLPCLHAQHHIHLAIIIQLAAHKAKPLWRRLDPESAIRHGAWGIRSRVLVGDLLGERGEGASGGGFEEFGVWARFEDCGPVVGVGCGVRGEFGWGAGASGVFVGSHVVLCEREILGVWKVGSDWVWCVVGGT